MAGFARLYDAMAPLYQSKTSAGGLNAISEAPSNSTAGSRKLEPAASSGQKHPAPGASRSGSTAAPSSQLDDSDSSDELNKSKNSSFTSYQPRSAANRSSTRRSEGNEDNSGALRRSGSPRPADSSARPREAERSLTQSTRPSLRSSGRAADVDDGASGSPSLARRKAADSKPVSKPYDSTDNMRLSVRDDLSSSDNSDATRGRFPDRSSRSLTRQTAATDNGDVDLPPRMDRFKSDNRDDGSSLSRRKNLESKSSDDDLPPQRSLYRDGTSSYRRRKEPGEKPAQDDDLPMRRSLLRASGKPVSRDEVPIYGRKEAEADRDSPPLRSTSREEPLNRRKEFSSASNKDGLSLRRGKSDSDSDSPPPRSFTAREKLALTTGGRDKSPPLKLSPRDELPARRKNNLDEPSDSLAFSRQRDSMSRTSNVDDLSWRRRKDADSRSSSPPLRSSSRNFSTKEADDDLPLRRKKVPADDRSKSPPLRDDLPLRKKVLNDDQDDLPLRRRKNIDDSDDSAPIRRRNDLGLKGDRAASPPLKSSPGRELSPRHSLKPNQRESPLSRSRRFGEGSDSESPPLKRDDGYLKRSRDLLALDASLTAQKAPLAEKGLSPRTGYRASGNLSPRRVEKPTDQRKSEETDVPSKSGNRSSPIRSEASAPSKTRGDTDQPKSGVLRRQVPAAPDPLDRKKPSARHFSDSESSSEENDKRKPIRSSPRSNLDGKSGRSFSPPTRTGGGATSGKGKDSASSPLKTGSGLKPLDNKQRVEEKRDIGKKGLTSNSLSPRRSSILDDKGDKKEPAYVKSSLRAASRDDFSVDGRKHSPGRDASPPRSGAQKPLSAERPTSFIPKRGTREEQSSTATKSKGPVGFEFSRYESPKLRIIKLRRPLPANLSGTRYAAVEEAARCINFVRTTKDDFKTPFLIWNDTFISMERLTQLKPFQRVNHFPGMSEICRKDLLAKNMEKLASRYPAEYKFVPRSWCLPDQMAKFRQHVQEQKSDAKPSYIGKPIDGASGRGIKIYKSAEEVPQTVESECVLQEYVSKPFLIENVKFDLRLYVLVTSCDPLRIYLYNDGFIRMSSEPYVDPQKCKADEELAFIHLTNCSVNKLNRQHDRTFDPTRRKGTTVSGTKRPLNFLNSYLQQNKYDVAAVWRSIVDLIMKTVFAAYPHILRSYRQCRPADRPGNGSVCFELLGFDILLDAELKPWLMEVNRSPSFDYENRNEEEVKLELLEETLMLLNVSPAEWKAAKQTADGPPDSVKATQKEASDLAALLARLKRQDRMKEADARICQKFRRIFPVDEATKQEKLVSQLQDAISALVEGASTEALLREVKTFYSSKTDEVAKKLAQLSSKTVQQLMAEGQAASSDSGSDGEDQQGRDRVSRRKLATKLPIGQVRSKDDAKKLDKNGRKQAKPHQKQQSQLSESTNPNEREQLGQRTLKFLNELSIRFPGKSNRGADQLLRQLQDNWHTRKADVSSYWRLSLDADKRRKVLDIARSNVRVALDKAVRMTASDVTVAARKLERLFEKLYNRLLWCHGQGLWETFSANAGWEAILRQSREEPTETEINCCRRVVQLCQDCLLVVYLYSDAAQQQQQKQQQQQQQLEQNLPKTPIAVP